MVYYTKLLTLLLTLLTLCPATVLAAQQFVVVIDAGHGGGDVGTPHRKCKMDEKVIALNVALKLGSLIESNYPDVKVVYTRKTDVYPTLPERTRIARTAKGNLFISIHVNAAMDASARGIETYVFGVSGLQGKSADEQKRIRERTMIERENLDIDGKQIDFETAVDIETKILCQTQREKHNKYSMEFARIVQENMMSDLRKSSYSNRAHDRGVKQKNIFVLCYSPMPSILVEMGYMSNPAEEKFLNTDEAQNLFTNAIYRGFEQYKQNWNRRQLRDDDEEVNSSPNLEPETKPEVEPETTSDLKLETKPEVKPETKPEVKPEPKPEVKPEAKPEVKPETQPEVKPETKPVLVPMVEKKECFRIQFTSSARRLKSGEAVLKGLWPVQCYEVSGYYRYTYGEASSKADLANELQNIRKLFPDAFVVHFDANGNRTK